MTCTSVCLFVCDHAAAALALPRPHILDVQNVKLAYAFSIGMVSLRLYWAGAYELVPCLSMALCVETRCPIVCWAVSMAR